MISLRVAMLKTPEVIARLTLGRALFAGRKLPELAKGLGQGISEFRKAPQDLTDDLQDALDAEARYRTS